MPQPILNTLKFVEKLVIAGIIQEQAKAHVEAVVDIMQINLDSLATKLGLQNAEARLDAKIENVQHELKATETRLTAHFEKAIAKQGTKLEKAIAEQGAKHDKCMAEQNGKFAVLYWMFGSLVAGVTSIALKLFLT